MLRVGNFALDWMGDCWRVAEVAVIKSGKNKGGERLANPLYHHTLERALTKMLDRMVGESHEDVETVKDLKALVASHYATIADACRAAGFKP